MRNKRILAIIPARGGSRRIPRKNVRDFLGKPIIAYSLESAIESGIFDEVMVSTDDQEIAEVAKKYGAAVPFMRSEKNSDDYATTADVVEEVLLEYKKRGQSYNYFCCIYPTAPFVTSKKIKTAIETLVESDVDAVIPVIKFSYPIKRGLNIESDGNLKMVWPENINVRSQDLEPVYHDAGQFYALKEESFLAQKKLFTNTAKPIIIPESEAQDIDTEEDWEMAEYKFKRLIEKNYEK